MDLTRFEDLLQRWQEGDASPAELQELGQSLRSDPERRRQLVGSVMLEVQLYGRFAGSAGAKAAQSRPRKRVWEAAAALLILAISVFLVGRLFLLKKTPTMPEAKEQPKPPAIRPAAVRPTPTLERYQRFLGRANVTLAQSLDLALEKGEGVPVKAELEEEKGNVVYTVTLAWEKQTREIEVEAVSGRILDSQLEAGDVSGLASKLKISLKDAIQRALAAVPGRAVEAEIEDERGRLVFEVKIVSKGELREVVLDAATGDVLDK